MADTPMTRRDPEPAGARPTRRDAASGAAVTRRDEPVATPPPTRRDGAAGGASAVDFGPDTGGLPAPVYEHYQPVPAGSLGAGGEAHRVLRVRDRQTGVERVVKVYGSNVRPDPALLRALQNAHSPYLVEVIEWGDHTDSYGYSYFDSDLNSPNGGWTLQGAPLTEFHRLMALPSSLQANETGF